jgi:hypothetical protein
MTEWTVALRGPSFDARLRTSGGGVALAASWYFEFTQPIVPPANATSVARLARRKRPGKKAGFIARDGEDLAAGCPHAMISYDGDVGRTQ